MDVARLGPAQAARVLLVSSGIHGIEGYAGSAAQTQWLKTSVFNSLADDAAVVLVHALNPYGMAHNRRGNEENVDLNRNFVDWEAGQKPAGHPLTAAALKAGLALPDHRKQVASFVRAHGRSVYQAALCAGQYDRSDAPIYGGTGPVWSNRVWSEIVATEANAAQDIVHLDLHTGYGPRGTATVMAAAAKMTPAGDRAVRLWGEATLLESDGGALSAVSGCIEQSLPRLLPRLSSDRAPLVATVEIGARPLADNLRALLADQRNRNAGGNGIPEIMQSCYNPQTQDKAWGQAAVKEYTRVLRQTLGAFHP